MRPLLSATASLVPLTQELKEEKGKLVGNLAYYNDYLQMSRLNVTFFSVNEIGKLCNPVTGRYNGLLGSLQRISNESAHFSQVKNESAHSCEGQTDLKADFSLFPVEINHMSPNYEIPVKVSSAAFYSDYFITSVNLTGGHVTKVTVLDTFNCLSIYAILLITITILVFWYLFKHVTKVNAVLFRLLSVALNQSTINTDGTIENLFNILYALTIFWFLQFFTSFISTEMTVSNQPEWIDSLSDLYHACVRTRNTENGGNLHNYTGMAPVFFKGLNIESVLEESLLPHAQDVLKLAKVYPIEGAQFLFVMGNVLAGKAAFIMDYGFWTGMKMLACATQHVNNQMARNRDPEAPLETTYRKSKEIISSATHYFIISKTLPDELEQQLKELSVRLFESNLHVLQHKKRTTLDGEYFRDQHPSVKLCFYNHDNTKDWQDQTNQVEGFELEYLLAAFYLLQLGELIGSIFLIGEIVSKVTIGFTKAWRAVNGQSKRRQQVAEGGEV